MTPLLAGKDAGAGTARAGAYARHRTLPVHVQREFADYLKCGRLEYGFLRVRCVDCHAERLVAFSPYTLRGPRIKTADTIVYVP